MFLKAAFNEKRNYNPDEHLRWTAFSVDMQLDSKYPLTPSVHKLVKHTFKILQHLLQDFERVFDHFFDTWRYKVNDTVTLINR